MADGFGRSRGGAAAGDGDEVKMGDGGGLAVTNLAWQRAAPCHG